MPAAASVGRSAGLSAGVLVVSLACDCKPVCGRFCAFCGVLSDTNKKEACPCRGASAGSAPVIGKLTMPH